MPSQLPKGRPVGSRTFDPLVAARFGRTVATLRTERGMSQMGLALTASIERAHMGRIERGEAIPNLVAMMKIASALGCSLVELVGAFEGTGRGGKSGSAQ